MVLLLVTLLITRLLLAQEPPSKVSRVERDVHLVCIFAKGHAQHGLAWKLHSVTHASCSFQHAQACSSNRKCAFLSALFRQVARTCCATKCVTVSTPKPRKPDSYTWPKPPSTSLTSSVACMLSRTSVMELAPCAFQVCSAAVFLWHATWTCRAVGQDCTTSSWLRGATIAGAHMKRVLPWRSLPMSSPRSCASALCIALARLNPKPLNSKA